jgi:hypothetical protein
LERGGDEMSRKPLQVLIDGPHRTPEGEVVIVGPINLPESRLCVKEAITGVASIMRGR